ncbi:hypothetical protein D4L85_27390 [Chryseolinea soli]|uniref:Uncharacterized protein n=1 Tax=Chryseolinea soli TaxID=2321403 RepID=A0A385SU52_9BACT|nr:hypothetical protein D4L85_27390 [Chryseolinea soli]
MLVKNTNKGDGDWFKNLLVKNTNKGDGPLSPTLQIKSWPVHLPIDAHPSNHWLQMMLRVNEFPTKPTCWCLTNKFF